MKHDSLLSTTAFSRKRDLILFSQTFVGKLRYYAFFQFGSFSLPADFLQETSDLKLSGNLDPNFFRKFLWESLDLTLSGKLDLILVRQIFPGETSDLTLPGILDLIPFWQNLNFFQEFPPGNFRSDAFRENQPCSVLFLSYFSLK